MERDLKVLSFPTGKEMVTCHLTVPRFDEVIREEYRVEEGLESLAAQMEFVAEQFASLARVFAEFPDSSYSPETYFINGNLTFVFRVPRRVLPRLRAQGWEPDDLDVETGGRVSGDLEDTSDA
jgi:hypothetical protein